jgi:type II secretory pathway pseudopilin PulG
MRFKKCWSGGILSQRSEGGFTLLETVIAMSVLFIAMAGLFSAILICSRLRQTNAEHAKARNAAEQIFSGIRGMPTIVDAYDRFGGGGSEETFDIEGLKPVSPNDPVGRVIVWRLKSGLKDRTTPPQPDPGSALAMSQDEIRAAQEAFSGGFPGMMEQSAYVSGTGWDDFLDTNKNGFVESTDDPQLMAVTVRVRWQPHSGVATQYYSAVIGKR